MKIDKTKLSNKLTEIFKRKPTNQEVENNNTDSFVILDIMFDEINEIKKELDFIKKQIASQ